MIVEEKHIDTISKTNSGFPEYLDFEKLRRESIEYIGKLSGKIWTDHNVHDPGITILEVLCYALLDLGYRTHLPIEDILAKNPADTSDTNFYTPAQILSCNPLTIIDYRKLLIDIPGVKNAWLIPAEKEDICKKKPGELKSDADTIFLNGLYRVSIELEKYPEKNNTIDINTFSKDILENVKAVLMNHRNLCEDFLSIHVLCHLEIGVCASIELEDDADAENVYLEMIDKLNTFFSPAPRFYTLQQMLEKDLSIDEIFAGRPFNKAESNGFVDTAELASIELRKEIHTSDVYNVLFQVKGIKKITSLRLNNCHDKNHIAGTWKMSIPESDIPSFSVTCSGFSFIRNGLPISVDTKKFDYVFEFGFNNEGKTTYPYTSAYLNLELPNGNFSETLGDYYSIQNDFPQVYGIGKGDLSENETTPRKAQALQLKGYLLFFDQLLANYLSQLQHIRSYFSLSAPKNKKDRHTYFLNQLNTVPEMEKLLRFSTGNAELVGSEGSTLALPVSTGIWEQLKINKGNLQDHISSLAPYAFHSLSEVNDAIQLLQNDLLINTNTTIQTIQAVDNSWFYAVVVTDPNYVLLCKKTFYTEQEAKQHASSVQYTAVHNGNYHSFITNDERFSFEIEFNITSYTGYLGLLVEDEALYSKRRKDFLNHLLARFSEKFTDFALLNWQDDQAISTAENFLSEYDSLSRNRGRARNYQSGGGNADNRSGFEKKVSALTGLSQDTTLCNFVVEPCEEHFTVSLLIAKEVLFESDEKFDSREEAETAAAAMIKSLANPAAYRPTHFAHEKNYRLKLHYGYGTPATHPTTFQNSQHAEQLANYLVQAIDPRLKETDVVISHTIWKAELRDHKNERLAISTEEYETAGKAHTAGIKLVKKTSDTAVWKATGYAPIPELQGEKTTTNEVVFIDYNAFKIDINDTIIKKPGQYTYDLLDKKNTFKLNPKTTFDNAKSAGSHAHIMLAMATDFNNWQIEKDSKTNHYIINICKNNIAEASFAIQIEEYEEAEMQLIQVYELIKEHTYTITETEYPNKWRFLFRLGYGEENTWHFQSDQEYDSYEDADKTAALFYKSISELKTSKGENSAISLGISGKGKAISVSPLINETTAPVSEEKITVLIQHQKELLKIYTDASENRLEKFIKSDRRNEQPSFLYRLINTNHIPARSFNPISGLNDHALLKRKIAAAYKQQQWFPSICMGGAVFEQHADEEGIVHYHYEIRFRNLPFTEGREIPVFTSTTGYPTQKEAEKAFQNNYLDILHIASKSETYGNDISIEAIYLPLTKKSLQKTPIAFVTKESRDLFFKKYGDNWIAEMAFVAAAYPVKVIKSNSPDFATWFCKEVTPEDKCCDDTFTKSVYYFSFSLANPLEGITDCKWISTDYFDKPEEALQEFLYFNRLLNYTGNWYIDCYFCPLTKKSQQHFFIHEVLAESSTCFSSQEEAWGSKGVEAFICAVQSGKGIRNYDRKTDCCYSFYVNCGESLLIHPCTYDTSEDRTQSINELYHGHKKIMDTKAFIITYEKADLIVHDKNSVRIAKLRDGVNIPSCLVAINIAEAILSKDSTWETREGIYYLKSADKKITLESYEKKEPPLFTDWKIMLEEWACFYPIVRTVTVRSVTIDEGGSEILTTHYKYSIEIKIPGFGSCGFDQTVDLPCTCESLVPTTSTHCYVAWKSACTFDSCDKAFEALILANNLLADFKNYYPVFDCNVNVYGIALNPEVTQDATRKGVASAINDIPGQIIARNPQCYQTPQDACKAVEDTKQLVNPGGLHVVEHLLLRPHYPHDCECDNGSQNCNSYANCYFPSYTSEITDPCFISPPLSFKPGTDPYSFIATVVLPAWPSVFCNQEKREQAEHILYSEAPAHVLLRVLWLRPMDFYHFESSFKEWKKWLAGIPPCNSNFLVCKFRDLVLNKEYNCLPECSVCLPCGESGVQIKTPCENQRSTSLPKHDRNGFNFLNLINDTFCMGEFFCGNDLKDTSGDVEARGINNHSSQKKLNNEIKYHKKEDSVKKNENNGESKVKKTKTSTKQIQEQLDVKEKAKFINGRHNRYLQLIKDVDDQTNRNPLSIKVQAFVQNNHPTPDQLEVLANEIIVNKKTDGKKSKLLNQKHKEDLLYASICHYLDKLIFNGKDQKKIAFLSLVLKQLKKVKISPLHLYKFWEQTDISFYDPELDIGIIKKLFTDK